MDKSTIEKRIIRKAEERFQKDFDNLVQLMQRNPIGPKLKIKIDGKDWWLVAGGSYRDGQALLDPYSINAPENNFDEVKSNLMKKYEQEETDNVLAKLESVAYLFEQGGM